MNKHYELLVGIGFRPSGAEILAAILQQDEDHGVEARTPKQQYEIDNYLVHHGSDRKDDKEKALFNDQPDHKVLQTVEAIATMIEDLPDEMLTLLLNRLGLRPTESDEGPDARFED